MVVVDCGRSNSSCCIHTILILIKGSLFSCAHCRVVYLCTGAKARPAFEHYHCCWGSHWPRWKDHNSGLCQRCEPSLVMLILLTLTFKALKTGPAVMSVCSYQTTLFQVQTSSSSTYQPLVQLMLFPCVCWHWNSPLPHCVCSYEALTFKKHFKTSSVGILCCCLATLAPCVLFWNFGT